ncbi:GNAT family N-acetyltransferase [Stackebrandtia albiflava]|uniref:GNAT family N-acetyltransferase n=1 Tax=Stackebrandtia albiflava TaxID=406432 RepID=UPI0011BD8B5C|nr:GNAT family N-acetyltransferase [Stackebrandtia albiflava]
MPTSTTDERPVGVQIRAATAHDLAEVGRIAVDAYRADGQLDESGYEAALRDAAGRARDAELLVAVIDERVVGAVALCPPGSRYAEICRADELEFRMLSVDPAAQGRGVGRLLVTACLERARELGCRAVVICTRAEHGDTAKRLYQRLGFTRLPDRDWAPVPGISLWAWQRLLDSTPPEAAARN